MGLAVRQQEESSREFAFSEQDFRFLTRLVSERTGIVLAEHKRDMVYSRLARRLRALRLGTFAQYCELLQGPGGVEEIGNFVNAITTNLTSFFREGHHFTHLRDKVLAPLEGVAPSQRRLRIWSAGCSSGMEPYSIAMTVRAGLPARKTWDARILATDIDTNMVATGAEGVYPVEQLQNIPPACREGVEMLDAKKRIAMPQDLKELIAFKELNLLGSWPMKGPFDAIFCRNVVIYFDKKTQQVLFDRFANMLKPEGWLYIGHSENLYTVTDRFELAGRTIYRRVR